MILYDPTSYHTVYITIQQDSIEYDIVKSYNTILDSMIQYPILSHETILLYFILYHILLYQYHITFHDKYKLYHFNFII